MTADLDVPVGQPVRRRGLELPSAAPRTLLEGAAVSAALAVFAFVVVPGGGGRDSSDLVLALLVAVGCFAATGAWHRLRPAVLGMVAAVSVVPFVVCLVAPTGGAGLRTGSFYVLAALTYAAVAAFCRTPARCAAAAVTAGLLGLLQLSQALTPWIASTSPSRLMIGTFYWHNQVGAYLLGTGLVAGATAVFGERRWRRIAAAVTPLCMAGVLLSGSRGSILVMAAGWVGIAALAAVQRTGARRALLRWTVVGVAAFVAVTGLTSTLFFPEAGSAVSAVDARGEGTAGGNLRYRVVTYRAALAVVREHPWTGAGLDSFREAGSPHLPVSFTRSPYVHNGYLQVLEEGGLLLGLPLLVAIALAAAAGARSVVRRWRAVADDWPRVACAVGAAGLLLHAAIDMDWSFPGLVVLVMLLLGVAGGESARRPGDRLAPRLGGRLAVALGVVVLTAGVAAAEGVQRWQRALPAEVDAASPDALAAGRSRLFADPRVDARLLRDAVPAFFTGTVTRPHDIVEDAVARTAELASVDGALQMRRAQALIALGRADEGLRVARELATEQGANRPFLVGEYAELLGAVGRTDDATRELAVALEGTRTAVAPVRWGLVGTLVRIDPQLHDRRAGCAATEVARLGPRPADVPPLPVVAGCPPAVR